MPSVVLIPYQSRYSENTLRWRNDLEIIRALASAPISAESHSVWVSALAERDDLLYFAIEAGSAHVGDIWLANVDRVNRKAEVRILIGFRESRGTGVGPDAINQLSERAFSAFQLHRLYAFVLAFNTPAIRAFKKAGFVVEARLKDDRWSASEGCFVDSLLLARINAAP